MDSVSGNGVQQIDEVMNETPKQLNGAAHQSKQPPNPTRTMKTTSADDFYTNLVSQLTKFSLGLVEKVNQGDGEASCHPQCHILDVKQGWKYVEALHKCAEIHLGHSINYHQFYLDAKQYMKWMKEEIMKSSQYLADGENTKVADDKNLTSFLDKTKELSRTLAHWRLKLEEFKMRSEMAVPINMRVEKLNEPRVVRCVHDYRVDGKFIREGEELQLMDNSNDATWKVRSEHGDEFLMASPFLVILGPIESALLEAFKLNQTYGELWTVLRRLARKVLINFISLLIDACSTYNERSWSSMPREKIETLLEIISLLDSMFGTTWHQQQPGLTNKLENWKASLHHSLATARLFPDDKNLSRCSLVKDSHLVMDLLKLFQDTWNNKNKFWGSTNNNMYTAVENIGDDGEFEAVYAVDEVYKLTKAMVTTEASQLTTSQQEENQTFVITGVVNPKDGNEISLDEAISLGVINQKEGKYIGGHDLSKQIPIPAAMSERLIKVEFTKTKISQEKRNDIGFITIKSCVETLPYSIKSVIDPQTKSQLSLEEAVRKGVLDQKHNIYKNLKTGHQMTFEDALEKGLLLVDFKTEEEQEGVKEEDVVSYAVYSAFDTKARQWMDFKKAVNFGLLNPEEGTFYDRANRQAMKLGEAVKNKLITAIVVNDPKTFDLLPLAESPNNLINGGK